MTVVLAPEALDDLNAALEFLGIRSPSAAARLRSRVFSAVENLAAGAFDGREEHLTTGEIVHGWPVPPLRIYYQRTARGLEILRLYHQARRPIARIRRRRPRR